MIQSFSLVKLLYISQYIVMAEAQWFYVSTEKVLGLMWLHTGYILSKPNYPNPNTIGISKILKRFI